MIHKHICITAFVRNPITDTDNLCEFLKDMAENVLKMKIVAGPVGAYVDDVGNRGPTATVCISTSHLAIHIWDEEGPYRVEFDVYSCKEFDTVDVLDRLHSAMHIIAHRVREVDRGL